MILSTRRASGEIRGLETTLVNHPHRSKHQQAKHTPDELAFLRLKQTPADTLAREIMDLRALNAELLAALKLIRRMASGLIDGEKTAAEVLAKCGSEAGVAIDKAEGR